MEMDGHEDEQATMADIAPTHESSQEEQKFSSPPSDLDWEPEILKVSDDDFSSDEELSEDSDEEEDPQGNPWKGEPKSMMHEKLKEKRESALASGNRGRTFAHEIGRQVRTGKRRRLVDDQISDWAHLEKAETVCHPVDAESSLPKSLRAVLSRNGKMTDEEILEERRNTEKWLIAKAKSFEKELCFWVTTPDTYTHARTH